MKSVNRILLPPAAVILATLGFRLTIYLDFQMGTQAWIFTGFVFPVLVTGSLFVLWKSILRAAFGGVLLCLVSTALAWLIILYNDNIDLVGESILLLSAFGQTAVVVLLSIACWIIMRITDTEA